MQFLAVQEAGTYFWELASAAAPKFSFSFFCFNFYLCRFFPCPLRKDQNYHQMIIDKKCAPCQNWGTIIDHVPKSTNSEPCVLAQSLQTLSQLFLNLLSCCVDVSFPTKRSQIRPIPPPCTTGCNTLSIQSIYCFPFHFLPLFAAELPRNLLIAARCQLPGGDPAICFFLFSLLDRCANFFSSHVHFIIYFINKQ